MGGSPVHLRPVSSCLLPPYVLVYGMAGNIADCLDVSGSVGDQTN